MKRIIFTGPCKAELLDAAMPVCNPGHVLVKTSISTISSGTERANIMGDLNVSWQGKPIKEAQWPRFGGYSTTGTIIEVGQGVTGLAVGDRVAMSWTTHCEYVCVPANLAYKLPECISDSAGALTHISTFPLAAIRKCRLEFGESAMIMGQGVLGQVALKLLRLAGAVPVIAVDPDALKREKALEYGADYALDPTEEGFADKVKQLTNGGVNVCIEVTGNGHALDQALDCMARFGRVALLGCTRDSNFTIDYYRKVHGPGITLVGAHTMARPDNESSPGWWTQRDDALSVIRMEQAGRLDLGTLVGEIHSPAEAPEVYHRLCTDRTFPVVQFDWSLI